jgi:hypothetical protein
MAEEPRSTFDFSDQFGSDPITRRYSRTGSADIRLAEAGAREAAATRQLAESNLAKVQAELTAQMAPMKMGVEMVTTMSELMKNRAALQEESAIRTAAAAISEGLGNPNLDLNGLSQLASGSNAIGLRDAQTGVTVRALLLDKFKQATDNAESPYEVDKNFSLLPATLAAEPEFQAVRTGALAQASLRQGVLKSSAAETTLGPVPRTPEGFIDVPKAEINIAGEIGAQDRRKEARDNIRFVQNVIQSLERKAGLGELTPNEQLEFDALRADELSLLKIILQRDVSEGSQSTEPDVPAAPTEDVIGTSIIPTGVVAAPDQAAAASAAATGGATSTPETPVSAPVPAAPLTLEEEARQAVKQGREAEIRASVAPGREKREAERNRKIEKGRRLINLRNLVKEKSRLLEAIYDDEKGQKLKKGVAPDSDIVKRVQARIAEIDTELSQK